MAVVAESGFSFLTRSGARRALALAAALLVFWQPADARRKRRSRPAQPSLKVQPSQAIERRVQDEIRKASTILEGLDEANLFDSPYLVSALYYHDGFLDGYPADRPDGDPSRRIIAHLSRLLTPELKARYVELLHDICEQQVVRSGSPEFLVPVRYSEPRRTSRRRRHRYAIDLFAPEGSPVRSATRGLVLLAEGGWDGGDPFSTSSRKGGNTTIVFDADTDRFFRYCHLESVTVEPGAFVDAGQKIGTVGHSGLNACRKGHGRHLHFEVNRFEGNGVEPLTYSGLRTLLRNSKDFPAAGE